MGISAAWDVLKNENGLEGGTPDVVVAIIDTGVDYNHIDLRNNIWVNTAEIPDNGVDDDGNGYIDDYYGWDCVNNDNDPMDDNGHGTHVAGIVAAENNETGTVGIAFGCMVMCIKAGNASGYFNNSDIAEAIQYAYMNGASVINMSFGGSSVSVAVEDALKAAYSECVLVASAGNDGLPNTYKAFYPAAFSWVIGVMSCNNLGKRSGFSNYDGTPFDSVEYEVFACGEQIVSTWPGNKTATMSGTSMACPAVSATAALLRSKYPDNNVYSNKFIQSQIVNTGIIGDDGYHRILNAVSAFNHQPKPDVKLYDYYFFDSADCSQNNNGNGVIESGETIRIAIELLNRGGVANEVNAIISIQSQNPYIEINVNSINIGSIGTYSIGDCGKIMDGETVAGTTVFFEITIAEDCPNDYRFDLPVNITYKNGMDAGDQSLYSCDCQLSNKVTNGVLLPNVISENITYTSDRIYIIANNTVIASGATVYFEPGTTILFDVSSNGNYVDPVVTVYGKLYFQGTEEKRITIRPSDTCSDSCKCGFKTGNENAVIQFNYCDLSCSRPNGNIFMNYCYLNEYGYANNTKKHIHQISHSFVDTYIDEIDYASGCLFFSSVSIYENASNNYFLIGKPQNQNTYHYYDFYNSSGVSHNNNIFNAPWGYIVCYIHNYSDALWSNTVLKGKIYSDYDRAFIPFCDTDGNLFIDINNQTCDCSEMFPFIEKVEFYDSGQLITDSKLGKGEYVIKAFFSRDMDTTEDISLYYGSVYPYSDYRIDGDWVDSKIWEGNISTNGIIESGIQYFSISDNAFALGDSFKNVKQLLANSISFTIDGTAMMAMNLQATATNTGIELSWVQDDYDTLMGYNVYRSTEKDGNYTRLNSTVIPSEDNTFVDEDAEPGITYWYTFTVVLSDMTESAPAGKVTCTAADTLVPAVYHTPVNQGYVGKNLVISCTASDNVGVESATLYYRTKGTTAWSTKNMLKQNDKYSATVLGSNLSMAGLEYYIVVKDGVNTVTKGTAKAPYSVVIKDASALSGLGDVDGDGTITTKDALMLIQSINGDLLLTDDQFRRADLNKDNVLSSVEALRILQYINGNVNTLEM
jgi:hypothetical protein